MTDETGSLMLMHELIFLRPPPILSSMHQTGLGTAKYPRMHLGQRQDQQSCTGEVPKFMPAHCKLRNGKLLVPVNPLLH